MAGLKTPNSTNIAVLDSRVIGDTCIGKFIIDATPSTFLGSGASSVLGAKIKIVNPFGVVIKDYTSSYDIAAPLTAAYEVNIPTQAGKQQYGTYLISLKLVDADSTEYELTKSINVCTYTSDSHPCDDRLRVVASCKNGTVTVSVAEPPLFKGRYAESRTQEWTIDYPTASGHAQETTTNGNFSLQLFQGVYKISGSVCATYHLGDNVYLRLGYEADVEKNVKCILDYTCIWPRLEALDEKIKSNCSQKDKDNYASIALNAVFLLRMAEMANDSGADASQYIIDLEKLLGCQCTCDCGGSPIVNGAPSTSIAIEGCNFTKTTVGLTDVYTFNGKNYFLTEDDTQNIITVSAVNEYGCVAYQQIFINVGNMYTALKAEINSSTEYNYWASVINNALTGLSSLCLGYTPENFNALTFKQKIQAIINAACAGGSCSTSVSGISFTKVGADVLVQFAQTGGYSADVFVDGVLKGTVLAGTNQLLLIGYADGATHSYSIVPKCSNGSNGTASAGSFGLIGCPSIAPPTLTDNTVNGVDCPYDLTTLIYPEPPVGIEVEWHTANNTNNSSLVADPENVSAGVYYAFAKNADDCYSAATVVTVICNGATSCTAPQTLLVVLGVGGNKISFQSASNPPSSYTVKRKAAADPDVDGSYTTIGTPTWNATTSRWEITDTTAVDNTLYTYKAISNCPSSSPAVLFNFANLDCPELTLTPNNTQLDYEFTNVGGQVDKYEVSIYDSTGAVLISTNTITPAFSSPISGSFDYLEGSETYQVRVKVFIGTFSKTCDFESVVMESTNYRLSASYNMSIDTVTGTGVPSPTIPSTGANGTKEGHHDGMSGTLTVGITGSAVPVTALQLKVNNVVVDCADISAGTGSYTVDFPSPVTDADDVDLVIVNASCP